MWRGAVWPAWCLCQQTAKREGGSPCNMDLAELAGGVAVITGSASGLGYALGVHARGLGMHVVLSDVRRGTLERAVSELRTSSSSARPTSRYLGAPAVRSSTWCRPTMQHTRSVRGASGGASTLRVNQSAARRGRPPAAPPPLGARSPARPRWGWPKCDLTRQTDPAVGIEAANPDACATSGQT